MSLSLCISLAALWYLFFWPYREYRLDKFRQDLFALRDELFDMALEGKIPFDAPAYGMLRSMINGTIRQGHRFGLTQFLVWLVFGRSAPSEKMASSFGATWRRHCEEVPDDVAAKLRSIQSRLHLSIGEQVVKTSAVLVFSVFGVGLWWMVMRLGGVVRDFVMRITPIEQIREVFAMLDASALLEMELDSPSA